MSKNWRVQGNKDFEEKSIKGQIEKHFHGVDGAAKEVRPSKHHQIIRNIPTQQLLLRRNGVLLRGNDH